jgi:cell division protein FtsA
MTKLDNLIMGLDIGSSKICCAICEIDDHGGLSLRGIGTSISGGMNNGVIEDKEELQRAISRAISRAEREAKVSTLNVVSNLPVRQIKFVKNIGILVSKETSGQISDNDKLECVRRSKNIVKDPNQQMVHIIPLSYKVDGILVQNPVGVFGKNLEVETQLVLSHTDSIQDLTGILKRLNLKIKGLVYDALSHSEVCLNEKERQNGAVCIDFGGRFTKVDIFKNNVLQQALIAPMGSETLTSDISQCLKVSIPEAERLKIIHGNIETKSIDPNETIEITTLEEGRKTVNKLLLCQIIESRMSELFKYINRGLSLDLGPDFTMVIGGGGSLLKGLGAFLKGRYLMEVREGLPEEVKPIIESSAYATAVGLVLFGVKTRAIQFNKVAGNQLKTKVKNWVKNFF